MLSKLVLKNATRNIKEYGIYFLTLTIGVAIFYMFNSIYSQQRVMEVTSAINDSMQNLSKLLSIVSIFVAFILGFLILYANNFFIKRRKKEIGLYMLLGMTKKTVSKILVLETLIIGIVSLIGGLIIGVFGSQFMSAFTANIFEADLSNLKFVFSSAAATKSVAYFGTIFFVVITFNSVNVGKYKLVNLLYAARNNEQVNVRNERLLLIFFVFSLTLIGYAYYVFIENGIININPLLFIAIICCTLGTFLFFFSVSTLICKALRKSKRFYYKDLNSFVIRQFESQINTNFISISVVCLVLTLFISIFSTGYSVQHAMFNELNNSVKFDFSLFKYDDVQEGIYDNLSNEVKGYFESYYEFELLYSPNSSQTYGKYDIDFTKMDFDQTNDDIYFVSLYDYNNIRALQGKEKTILPDDRYFVLGNHVLSKPIAEQFAFEKKSLVFDKISLLPQDIITDVFFDNYTFGVIIFVVPDFITKDMTIAERVLNIQCANTESEKKLNDELSMYGSPNVPSTNACSYFASRLNIYNAYISTKAIASFLAMYLGSVFIITAAAILAIQQLAQASNNYECYTLFRKLGVGEKTLSKTLFLQVLIYFIFPLSLAVIHSVVGLIVANEVIQLFDRIKVIQNIIFSLGVVLLLYGSYFIITYLECKNIIGICKNYNYK
jgi:putative ABC transport system permease protein